MDVLADFKTCEQRAETLRLTERLLTLNEYEHFYS